MLKVVTQIRFLSLWWPSGLSGAAQEDAQQHKTNTKHFFKKYKVNFCHRFVLKVVAQIRFLSLWWPSGLFGAVKEDPQQHKEHEIFHKKIELNFCHRFVLKVVTQIRFYVPLVTIWSFWGCWPSGLSRAVKEDPQQHKTNTKDFTKKYRPNFCHRFVLKVVTQIRFLSLWWPSGLSGAAQEDAQQHKTNTKHF